MPQSGIIKPKAQFLSSGSVSPIFREHYEFGTMCEFTCPACHQTVIWFESGLKSHRAECKCGKWDVNISFEMSEKP